MMRSSAQACLTTSCKHVRQAVSVAEMWGSWGRCQRGTGLLTRLMRTYDGLEAPSSAALSTKSDDET